MTDFLYLVSTLVAFAIALWYVSACNRLTGGTSHA